MLLPLLSIGQYPEKPIHIGDKLPAVLCSNIINNNTTDVELSAYKGKVIIFDFWATWCSSCVIHLSLMDSLQYLFKDKLQCILVSTATTGDTKEKVQSFLQKRVQAGHSLSLPVIIGDTLLTRFFPHRLLPHYVWINTSGIVAAITDEDALTAVNINTLYNEKRIALHLKQDVMDYNSRQPLLQDGNAGGMDKLVSRGMLTCYIEGLSSGGSINNYGFTKKVTYLNMPILALYQAVLGLDGNRIIVHTRDSSRFFQQEQSTEAWHRHFYSYECIVPATLSQQRLHEITVADLDNYLQLSGKMEIQNMPCYLLVKQPAVNGNLQQNTTPIYAIHNEPLSALLQQWNSQLVTSTSKTIFIDESGIDTTVTLSLHAPVNNIPALKEELNTYGLDLVPATRLLPVFVINEPKTNKIQ